MSHLSNLPGEGSKQNKLSTLAAFSAASGLVLFAVLGMLGLRDDIILAGLTFCSVILAVIFADNLRRRKGKSAGSSAARFAAFQDVTEQDPVAAFVCDKMGRLTWTNRAGHDLIGTRAGTAVTLMQILDGIVAEPKPVLRRLQEEAEAAGTANETLFGPSKRVFLYLRQTQDYNYWRIDAKDSLDPSTATGAPMVTVGRNQTILFMNEAAKQLIGQRQLSLDQLTCGRDLQPGTTNMVMTSAGQRTVFVSQFPLQGGRTQLFLFPVSNEQAPGVLSLTDLPVPLMRLSPAGAIEEINQMAMSLLGQGDLSGQHVGDVFESMGNRIEDWLTEAAQTQKDSESEFLRVKSGKKEIYVQIALKRSLDQGEPGFIAVVTDATELKSLEAQFVQSQKMQAIGQLAGGVAHDFNNLLTAISGHCDLMLLRHDQGDQDYADLMQIHQNANRAAALVSQLLAFSRKQTLQPETLDLRDTLSDLTHLLNRLVGEKVDLSLSHDPVLKAIRADKRQLEQVIMNLVVNARDAMPDGGFITIETESLALTAPLKRDRVTVPAGDYVVVRVKDEGTGIPQESLQKIFEPFFTTKRTGEGTGLGLSTAYGIVKQTGGFIFADSEVGHGTSFSLLFPAAEVTKPTATDARETTARPLMGSCDGVVLLVEDEAPVRAFASRALQMRGFKVIEAASAEEALEILTDNTLKVDVFVTDVVMPGMDGPTWVRQALKERPSVRVVFVSGYAEGAFDRDQPAIRNSVFLPKPFSLTDLTSTVQDQLH